MTKKNYIAIAAVLKAVRDSYSAPRNVNLFRATDEIIAGLANVFAADNHLFSRSRFAEACGASRLAD